MSEVSEVSRVSPSAMFVASYLLSFHDIADFLEELVEALRGEPDA